ncbi:hypothetical protein D3C78_1664700 [compost metagenome]
MADQPKCKGSHQQGCHQSPQTMGDMDGLARLLAEHPELVTGMTERQMEGLPPLQLVLPTDLTNRQLDAGHGGIVG